jgi:hypothetical protein
MHRRFCAASGCCDVNPEQRHVTFHWLFSPASGFVSGKKLLTLRGLLAGVVQSHPHACLLTFRIAPVKKAGDAWESRPWLR